MWLFPSLRFDKYLIKIGSLSIQSSGGEVPSLLQIKKLTPLNTELFL